MDILIVEDEPRVASLLKQGLEELGHTAEVAHTVEAARHLLNNAIFHVAVVDINLPDGNGYDLTRWVRQMQINTPILMLTAYSTTANKIEGFDAGADDYLVKPFEFSELVARIQALHKRTSLLTSGNNILRFADLEMNLRDMTVKRGGKKIQLSNREWMLLELMMRNAGRALKRSEITEKVWEYNFDTGTNVIDVYINNLRKKIDKDFSPKLIQTINGVGYMLKKEEVEV
jgi:DNA-binding response OmpR family regulator